MISTALQCPKCQCATSIIMLEENLHADKCDKCKGTWLDGKELSQLTGMSEDLPKIDQMLEVGKKTKIPCPRCLFARNPSLLIEIPYSYATEDTKKELFIEYCGSCKGIWLDNKELTSVLSILKKFRIQARLDRLK
jgi:Zn-finger nucleic acid-binding protein